MARRTLSLHARQLLAASLGLVAFLGLTGYALDHAFRETVLSNLHEQMQNSAFAYVSEFEFTRNGELIPPPMDRAPDGRFSQPGSGLYAEARGSTLHWDSPSVLGRHLPESPQLKPGDQSFDGPLSFIDSDGSHRSVYRYAYGLAWERGVTGDWSEVTRFTISVFLDSAVFDQQVQVFRRALWGYLGLAGLLLILVQTLVLRWSLQPLRRLALELNRVQRGVSQGLSGRHPRELEPITESINALIDSERSHLEQSRNTLSDLAHSLKTPLAVLRSHLDAGTGPDELRADVQTQVRRMNDIVSYQLSRAARSGHALFSAPIAVEPRAEEIVASLEKVYAGKGVICEFEIDAAARFHGELGDLQELLGNLVENAFKWAKSRVLLSVRVEPAERQRRPGVSFVVEDDGPGIAAENVEHLLQRGVRGDERVQGHGIGLAIVQDIVRAYRGELKVDRSNELGGARFTVRIPPVF